MALTEIEQRRRNFGMALLICSTENLKKGLQEVVLENNPERIADTVHRLKELVWFLEANS